MKSTSPKQLVELLPLFFNEGRDLKKGFRLNPDPSGCCTSCGVICSPSPPTMLLASPYSYGVPPPILCSPCRRSPHFGLPHYGTPLPHYGTPLPHYGTPLPHFGTPLPHFHAAVPGTPFAGAPYLGTPYVGTPYYATPLPGAAYFGPVTVDQSQFVAEFDSCSSGIRTVDWDEAEWDISTKSFLELSRTLHERKAPLAPNAKSFSVACKSTDGLAASVYWISPSVKQLTVKLDTGVAAHAVKTMFRDLRARGISLESLTVKWQRASEDRMEMESVARGLRDALFGMPKLKEVSLPFDMACPQSAAWSALSQLPNLETLTAGLRTVSGSCVAPLVSPFSCSPFLPVPASPYAYASPGVHWSPAARLASGAFPILRTLRVAASLSECAAFVQQTTPRIGTLELRAPVLAHPGDLTQALSVIAASVPYLSELTVHIAQACYQETPDWLDVCALGGCRALTRVTIHHPFYNGHPIQWNRYTACCLPRTDVIFRGTIE